jgi:protein-L-isoaspartate(D-aspartate) O-methyltransferase
MSQFSIARRTMLDNQIRTADVTDAAVLAAFGSVPREAFVAPELQPLAYTDLALRLTPGAPGRWLMAASPLAKLIQLANAGPTDTALVVGSGSGYSVAILAAIAASVVGLEEDDALVASSTATLAGLGIANATIVKGALTEGVSKTAPYNVIFVEGAVDILPETLTAQLADGGRLVVVEGHGGSGCARIYTKTAGLVTGRNAFNCAAKPLPGFERKPEFVF